MPQCLDCKGEALPGVTRCAKHLLSERVYHRRYRGRTARAWVPGKKGRPTLYADDTLRAMLDAPTVTALDDEAKLAKALLATCHLCGREGPRAMLTAHLRQDHLVTR